MDDEYRGFRFTDVVTVATVTTHTRTATEFDAAGKPTGRRAQSAITLSSADGAKVNDSKLALLRASMEHHIDKQLDAPIAQGQ
jgi:hypothetical protein